MSEIGDGGPAFPREEYQSPPSGRGQEGMSLRDYFAGQALVGVSSIELSHEAIKAFGSPTNVHAALAKCSYAIADAMLAARKAKP